MTVLLLSSSRVEIEHTLGHLLCILGGLAGAVAGDGPTTGQGLCDVHWWLSWYEVSHVELLYGGLVLVAHCSHEKLLLVLLREVELLEMS